MVQSGEVRSYIPELNFLSNQTWHRFDLDTRESDLLAGKYPIRGETIKNMAKNTRQKDPIRLYENKARPKCVHMGI